MIGRGAEVVFHVAGALHIVRLEALAAELGEHRGQRLLHDIDQRVQPAAMRHADGDLADAGRCHRLDDGVQRRNGDLAAFQAEPLGGDVALLAERLEAFRLGELHQDGALGLRVERGAPGRAFHPALDPGLLVGVLDVHELDADRAAIGLAQDGHDLAQRGGLAAKHVVDEDRLVEVVVGETIGARIEFGMRPGNLQPERIEPRLQMAAHAVGADQHQGAQRGDRGGADLLAGQQHGRHCRGGASGGGGGGSSHSPDSGGAAPRRRRWPPPGPSAHRRSARRTVRRRSDRRKPGLAAQRAYCSPRKAAFAPLKADARMSTPAIDQDPLLPLSGHRATCRSVEPLAARSGRFNRMSSRHANAPRASARGASVFQMRRQAGFSSEPAGGEARGRSPRRRLAGATLAAFGACGCSGGAGGRWRSSVMNWSNSALSLAKRSRSRKRRIPSAPPPAGAASRCGIHRRRGCRWSGPAAPRCRTSSSSRPRAAAALPGRAERPDSRHDGSVPSIPCVLSIVRTTTAQARPATKGQSRARPRRCAAAWAASSTSASSPNPAGSSRSVPGRPAPTGNSPCPDCRTFHGLQQPDMAALM